MLRFRLIGFVVLFVAGQSAAAAATRVWPNLTGIGACQATLQACIDGAAPGDTVLIGSDDLLFPDAYTFIDEHVTIGQSLTLAAAAGIDAVFAAGRRIAIASAPAGAHQITLRGLIVRDGSINIVHRSSADSSYRVERLRVLETDGSAISDCAVYFSDEGAGRPQFIAGDNVLEFRRARGSTLRNGLCAGGLGGPWQVDFFRNRIRAENGALLAALSVAGTSSGPVTIGANQILGSGFTSGIGVFQNPGSTANTLDIDNNVVTGQQVADAGVIEYAIRLQLSETALRLRNNTVAFNGKGVLIAPSASVSGRVANNLVAFNTHAGLAIGAGVAVSNGHNLVHGNGFDSFTPGPGTVIADPLLGGRRDPRPPSSSPAYNAGSNADAPLFLGIGFDADGERRLANGTVDIGAHEYTGDLAVAHAATPANLDNNYTAVDSLFGQLGGNERLLATPHRRGGSAAERAQTLGVFADAVTPGRYYVFHQAPAVAMSPQRRFSVLAPWGGATSFVHATALGSVVGQYGRIEHAELDGLPGAIAFAIGNWNPGGSLSGVYHDHRLALEYTGGRWHLRNEDAADMPAGVPFNVAVAPLGSPNAFFAKLGSGGGRELRLEHPLLDGNDCAAPQLMRVDDPFDGVTTVNDVPLALDYRAGYGGAPGRWHVVAEGPGTPAFPPDAAFNVLVPGAQANRCRDDRIFADGLEP